MSYKELFAKFICVQVLVGSLWACNISSTKEVDRGKPSAGKNDPTPTPTPNGGRSSPGSLDSGSGSETLSAPVPITGGNQTPDEDDKPNVDTKNAAKRKASLQCIEESKPTEQLPTVLIGCRLIDPDNVRTKKHITSILVYQWKVDSKFKILANIERAHSDSNYDVYYVFSASTFTDLQIGTKAISLLVKDTFDSDSSYNLIQNFESALSPHSEPVGSAFYDDIKARMNKTFEGGLSPIPSLP